MGKPNPHLRLLTLLLTCVSISVKARDETLSPKLPLTGNTRFSLHPKPGRSLGMCHQEVDSKDGVAADSQLSPGLEARKEWRVDTT